MSRYARECCSDGAKRRLQAWENSRVACSSSSELAAEDIGVVEEVEGPAAPEATTAAAAWTGASAAAYVTEESADVVAIVGEAEGELADSEVAAAVRAPRTSAEAIPTAPDCSHQPTGEANPERSHRQSGPVDFFSPQRVHPAACHRKLAVAAVAGAVEDRALLGQGVRAISGAT